jgi:hypothetical protein
MDLSITEAQWFINHLRGKTFETFHYAADSQLETLKNRDIDFLERYLLVLLTLLFFFKAKTKEQEVKVYFLRADYVSRDNQSLGDSLRN